MVVLKILLLYVCLAALLWGLGNSIQRMIYTEVSTGLPWRGAAGAAVIITVGVLWPLGFNSIASEWRWPITFDDQFLFQNVTRTAVEFEAFLVPDEAGREIRYHRRPTVRGYEYRDDSGRVMPTSPLVMIGIPKSGDPIRFEVVKDAEGYIDRSRGGTYYVAPDGTEYAESDLLTGGLATISYGQVFIILTGDLLIWAAWFLVIWLLLRFQWPHALGLSIPAWLFWGLVLNVTI